jgi:hypothetical protein
MATKVLTNAYLSFAGVVLSDHLFSIELPEGFETQDFTAMSATTRTYKPGLATGQLKATLFQDYAPGSVDATFAAQAGLVVAIEVRHDAGAVSTSNPKWTFQGFWSAYNPLAGEVGGRDTCEVTIDLAGPITRATA